MQTRAHYIETLRERENQETATNLFLAEGWVGDYTVDELDRIDRSINDLPYPDTEYQDPDGYDWVDDNGNLIIPASVIPFRTEECIERVVYNNETFTISYYGDGTVRSVNH